MRRHVVAVRPYLYYVQVKNEGVGALYSGLSAALARQASYTTLRLGLYDLLKRLVLDRELVEAYLHYLTTTSCA